ncbi:MAG: rane protein [Cryptosporangiaceae bacterium]|nr:rane protein [Cryptosporangiaceae bacterium]
MRRAIVVAHAYHLPRAVALCRAVGVDADGVGNTRRHRDAWRRGALREVPAAVKAAWDVLTRPAPTYLGPRLPGVERALSTP